MQTWDYMILCIPAKAETFNPDSMEKLLSQWGREGWELAVIDRMPDMIVVYLKQQTTK